MGNCTSTDVNTENICHICKKELSKRYVKCKRCDNNFHHSCAFFTNNNLKVCCVCNSSDSYYDKIGFNTELVPRRQTM